MTTKTETGTETNRAIPSGTAASGERAPTGPLDRSPSSPWDEGLLVGIGGVFAGVIGVMAVYRELFVDVLPFLAAFAVLGVWSLRSSSAGLRWALAGLMTILIAVNAVFAIEDLSHPESPGPFIFSAIVIGFGIATIVLAVVSARGRSLPVGPLWLGVGSLMGIVAIGSFIAAAGVEDDEALPGDEVIIAKDVNYPDEVTVTASTDGILIENRDAFRHNFVIDDEIAADELPAGTDVRIDVSGLAPGTYRFYCAVSGHDGMEGQLTVQ